MRDISRTLLSKGTHPGLSYRSSSAGPVLADASSPDELRLLLLDFDLDRTPVGQPTSSYQNFVK